MQVFVVLDFAPYEGYGEPHAVCSTRERAEAVAEKLKAKDAGGQYEIFERTLDKEPD